MAPGTQTMRWTHPPGATCGPLTTSIPLCDGLCGVHILAERQTCECNHLPSLQRAVGLCPPLPAPGFLFTAVVLAYRLRLLVPVAQVPPLRGGGAGGAGLAMETLFSFTYTVTTDDRLSGRVIREHKTLTSPGFLRGFSTVASVSWHVHVLNATGDCS